MHERQITISSDNEFWEQPRSIPWWEYQGVRLSFLLTYLERGWPRPIPSAQWFHDKKHVRVFADDLFLCPECGLFHGLGRFEHEHVNTEGKIWALIKHPKEYVGRPNETWIDRSSGHWQLDPTDTSRLRDFATSRLSVPQFIMQSCKSDHCQATKLKAIKEFKAENRCNKNEILPQTQIFLESSKTPKPEPSYSSLVYLIHGAGHHKIGIALDVKKRLKGIQTSCPFPVEILMTWKSENALGVEQAMHRRFAQHRLKGEWFQLPAGVLAMLRGIADIDSEFLTSD